jgi:hypothetical protein
MASLSSLYSIPREIREKILLLVLPAIFHLRFDQEISTFQHSPLFLLEVSHIIRAETIDLLQRHVVIQVPSLETLVHFVPEKPGSSDSFFRAWPRHLRVRVLCPLTMFIRNIPNDQQDDKFDAPYSAYAKSQIHSWGSVLARLPSTTKTLIFDFSHTGYSIRPYTLGGLVQRVSTRLFIVSRGKTKVKVEGCNTEYGRRYLESCLPGHQSDSQTKSILTGQRSSEDT